MDQAAKDEIIAKLRVTRPGVDLYGYVMPKSGRFFVYRPATRGERIVYHKLAADKKALDAMDSLMGCVLYPDGDALKAEIDRAPFVVNGLSDKIVEASGLDEEAFTEKY